MVFAFCKVCEKLLNLDEDYWAEKGFDSFCHDHIPEKPDTEHFPKEKNQRRLWETDPYWFDF